MPVLNPLTRRRFVAGAGALAALPGAAFGQGDGFRVIRAQEAGYDGVSPGPVLFVRRGEELKVRLVNELAAPTAIHWHGVRVPNAMDGTPLAQPPVAPGASFDYRFTPPDAGTFWYHPPLRTAQNRVLSGFLIVQEKIPPRVDDDIPMLIESVESKFTANGLPLLNIPVWPKSRLRLRLANATERFVTLRVDGHPMHVVGIDGQPAEPFLSRESRITLSPGNRADVLIDAIMKPSSEAAILVRQDDSEAALARVIYGDGVVPPGATMPDGYAGEAVKPLEPNPLPAKMDFRGALRIDLPLVDSGAGTLAAKPLFLVRRGRTVVMAITNRGALPQTVHIHGHHARLLDNLDDGWKPYWLDTILAVPHQTTRVAFVADNPGKWLLQARAIGADASALPWFDVT